MMPHLLRITLVADEGYIGGSEMITKVITSEPSTPPPPSSHPLTRTLCSVLNSTLNDDAHSGSRYTAATATQATRKALCAPVSV